MANTKLSLWDRLRGETPAFFKRIQTIGIAISGLATTLASLHVLPGAVTGVLIAVGATATAVSQFAVKTISGESSTNIFAK